MEGAKDRHSVFRGGLYSQQANDRHAKSLGRALQIGIIAFGNDKPGDWQPEQKYWHREQNGPMLLACRHVT